MENKFKVGDKVRIKAGVDLRNVSLTPEDVNGEITITGAAFVGLWGLKELQGKPSYQITVQKLTKVKEAWCVPESFLEPAEKKLDNLPLKGALDLSIKQWEYLEDTGSDIKKAWCIREGYVFVRAYCFLCEYADQQLNTCEYADQQLTTEEEGLLGSKCLLHCPWAKEKQSKFACELSDSPYTAWKQTSTPAARSYAASQVVAWLKELRDKYCLGVKEECYRLLFSVYLLAKDKVEAREKGKEIKRCIDISSTYLLEVKETH